MQAGRLEVESIPVMVHGQPGASALGITVGRLGEIHLLVRPEDYAIAVDILQPEEYMELTDISDPVVYIEPHEDENHATE